MAKKTLVYKYKIQYAYYMDYDHPPIDVKDTTVTVLQKSEQKAEDKFWSTPPGSILLKSYGNTRILYIEYLGEFFE